MKSRNFCKSVALALVIVPVTLAGCGQWMKAPEPDTVMNGSIEGLTPEQNRMFLEGAEAFDEIYTPETGLGPVFVAASCASCHAGDNRGHPLTNLIRFGQSDSTGNTWLQQGGPQLQHHAIPGYLGESLPLGAPHTTLIAPIVAGNGFLEAVPDADLINMADPDDLNGDGISGRVNWVNIPTWVLPASTAIHNGTRYIGRFGHKASTYNLHQQIVTAFNQDMGVTSSFLPAAPVNYLSGNTPVISMDPDVDDREINALVFYIQSLQKPLPRDPGNANVMAGSGLFTKIGCAACHKETLMTGYSPIPGLSFQTFHPYTDLLLHDMGAELNDGYTEGAASTSEWRTAPLWGLGLSGAVQGGKWFLLHDGRALSLEQAIEKHGGEAAASRAKYLSLTQAEKSDILQFLQSL